MKLIMLRPVEPSESDCCGSGCNPCIFDVYKQKLKLYENALCEQVEITDFENGISQLEYSTFIVIFKIDVCDGHTLLVFKNKTGTKVWWKLGDHFLYKYIGDNSCTRAYSPIKLNNMINENFDFMVLVKDYKNNSVSSRLCSLEVGDETLWRGPYGSYKLSTNQFKRIIMVAQGTGIAPLYSIIKKIIDDEDELTNVILLYCCSSFPQILLRNELYEFSSFWNFNYNVYISNSENCSEKSYYKEPLEYHRLSHEDIKNYRDFSDDDHIIVCGSKEFNEHFKFIFLQESVKELNIFLF